MGYKKEKMKLTTKHFSHFKKRKNPCIFTKALLKMFGEYACLNFKKSHEA